jgi:peptidoglycan/LPS O-acetylase OafA/YrhL
MNTREVTLGHWRFVCLLWFIALTIATHLPQATPSDDPVFVPPDKLLHFISFGMLAFFFMCTGAVKNRWACWCVVALWALADEVTQDLLPLNRAFSGADLIAGELGIAAFMVWGGAISRPATVKIFERVDGILALGRNWIILFFICALVTSVCTGLIWYALQVLEEEQFSSAAFFIAFLIATGCALCFIVRKGELQQEAKQIAKSMIPSIIGTMVISAMVGFFVSHTTFNPWVVAMATLVVGARASWNRAT